MTDDKRPLATLYLPLDVRTVADIVKAVAREAPDAVFENDPADQSIIHIRRPG